MNIADFKMANVDGMTVITDEEMRRVLGERYVDFRCADYWMMATMRLGPCWQMADVENWVMENG